MAQPGSTVCFVFPLGKVNPTQQSKLELALIKHPEIDPTFVIDFDQVSGECTLSAAPNPSYRFPRRNGVSPDVQAHELIQRIVAEALTVALGLRFSNR